MSRSRGPEVKYKCLNDCQQTGCPGHTVRFEVFHTVDLVEVFIDGECSHRFDKHEWRAIKKSEEGIE